MALNPRITHWHQKLVWIVGASSGIGQETASLLHREGARVVVSARQAEALQRFVQAHPGSDAMPMDITSEAEVKHAATSLFTKHGVPDLVFVCAGHYRAQRATQFDLQEMLKHQQVNYVGALLVLDAVLAPMVQRRQGHVSLMGSVAGYRGLPNGLAYGPTKAALINLADTLYLDLNDQGLGVSIVNPGFVETTLTAQNQFTMPALISASEAARQIVAGWAKGSFEIHFPKRFTRGLKALQWASHGLYFAAIKRATGL